MRLHSKVAIVTGSAQGIGESIATLFAQEGASVVLLDTLQAEGQKLETILQSKGLSVVFIPMDVTDQTAWTNAVNTTIQRFGKVDILVNNAAIRDRSDIENTSEEDWDKVMAVNVKGVFLGTKSVIPAMRSNGEGSIINLSSQMGMVGSKLSSPAYQTSKGAVRIFSKVTAIRHAHEHIRVNSIHPGVVLTPFTNERLKPGTSTLKSHLDKIPLGRIGTGEDIAYGAVYLASDESSFVTGSELVIDGGWTAE